MDKVITTIKPDKAPSRILQNCSDGSHPPYTGEFLRRTKPLTNNVISISTPTGEPPFFEKQYMAYLTKHQRERVSELEHTVLDKLTFYPADPSSNLPVATKFDAGKLDWSLVPFEALEDMVKVLEFGANKYKAWNFTEGGGLKYSRVINSLLRHTYAYMRGQDKDPESGLPHLGHMACNILFLLYYEKYKEKFNNDDRRTEADKI